MISGGGGRGEGGRGVHDDKLTNIYYTSDGLYASILSRDQVPNQFILATSLLPRRPNMKAK